MNAQTSGGEFHRAGTGGVSLIDRLADWLSLHVDEDDIRAGRGTELNPGGDVAWAALALGISESSANDMLRRICRGLGRQAI